MNDTTDSTPESPTAAQFDELIRLLTPPEPKETVEPQDSGSGVADVSETPDRDLTPYEAGQRSLIYYPTAGHSKELAGKTFRVSDL
jgi:hypothetical protein